MNTERGLEEDLRRLVEEHPLAFVISQGEDGLSATPMPLLQDQGDNGSWHKCRR
jgi:predicted FMN-binding regulatory protein PaiB